MVGTVFEATINEYGLSVIHSDDYGCYYMYLFDRNNRGSVYDSKRLDDADATSYDDVRSWYCWAIDKIVRREVQLGVPTTKEN